MSNLFNLDATVIYIRFIYLNKLSIELNSQVSAACEMNVGMKILNAFILGSNLSGTYETYCILIKIPALWMPATLAENCQK